MTPMKFPERIRYCGSTWNLEEYAFIAVSWDGSPIARYTAYVDGAWETVWADMTGEVKKVEY